MRQVVQPLRGGAVRVVDVPAPVIGPTEVLVRTAVSTVSSGTERSITGLARQNLVQKARSRPDLVRQVVTRAKADGLAATYQAVQRRLDGDLPLGYSACGTVVQVGAAVDTLRPGDLVATAGAGAANHAELQAVPALLCAKVPDGVTPEAAAFATIGSIALHGLRLADVGPGSKVLVVGLGLIGQLAARLAAASGCDVLGIDVSPLARATADAVGIRALDEGGAVDAEIERWSRGRGADAVLVAVGAPDASILARVPPRCRDRATVVVVGDVPVELERRALYERELTVRFARSYGPGRYERAYEEWAVDMPAGHVRWTEGRNLEAVLDLLASGRLRVDDLVSKQWPIAEATAAYEALEAGGMIAVQLTYPERESAPVQPLQRSTSASRPRNGVGLVGAGAFLSGTLLPALREAGLDDLRAVASASGVSAARLQGAAGVDRVAADADAVIGADDVDIVVIATPHDLHADLAVRALEAGKHVWCEKPLALTLDDLDRVEAAWRTSGTQLFVGFNRRWAPTLLDAAAHLAGRGPHVVTYRVNAGRVPEGHWYGDRRQGGRLLGEVCHFVDACSAITGELPVRVGALAGAGGELLLAEDVVVQVALDGGSLASISYASRGHHRTAKERIDVLGGQRSVVIDDFRALSIDGGRAQGRRRDKGHTAAAAAFARAIDTGDTSATEAMLATSRATIAAAATLGT